MQNCRVFPNHNQVTRTASLSDRIERAKAEKYERTDRAYLYQGCLEAD